MNTNENIGSNTQEEVIVLGVASVETQGQPGLPTEGVDQRIMAGISDE